MKKYNSDKKIIYRPPELNKKKLIQVVILIILYLLALYLIFN